ncbi:MAG TPA: hypothetical protein VEI94_03790 [Candidatus Bathyarchaeia archaeon]|nr:hypothetical protein [Candidatus Bathyarchaeia archaeon]
MERRELRAAAVVVFAGLFLTLSLWLVVDRIAGHLPLDPSLQAAIRHVHEQPDHESF